MKQGDGCSEPWIGRLDTVRFAEITGGTGQREIFKVVGSILRPGNDVFDVENGSLQSLGDTAILASVRCSLTNRQIGIEFRHRLSGVGIAKQRKRFAPEQR